MKTWVYVDAFNLYFGCVKHTPYRWLDISRVCSFLLPGHEIGRIKYFTALVKSLPSDPEAPRRQQTYLRALRTLPDFEIIYGHFLTHQVMMPLASPEPGKPRFVKVLRTDEKGSDVNLATHLLHDGFQNCYECAVVVSGDSDLLSAVRIVIENLSKTLGVLNPQKRPSRVLARHATFYKHVRQTVLAASQFPATISDEHGEFTKPQGW